MTQLLEKAYEEVKKASPEVQDCIAELILAELADEARWDAAFADSQDILAGMAAEAMEEYHAGKTKDLDPDMLGHEE